MATKYRYYANVGYDTIDVMLFDMAYTDYPLKAWVQLVIKNISAPVPSFSVAPNPVCPSCHNEHQVCVEMDSTDYALYNFYEVTSSWVEWFNPDQTYSAGVGQPPFCASYIHTGIDSVMMYWENQCGIDTLVLPVFISNQPTFIADTVCEGNFTTLTASTPCSDNTFTSWEWDFGDGYIASGVSVTHIFAGAGLYVVTLTVTDDCGNTETTHGQVLVKGMPVIEAELSYYNNCTTDSIIGTIINPDPNYEYVWFVSPSNAISFPNGYTGTPIDMIVNGSMLTIPTYIFIQATDTITGCKSIDTLLFFPCCIDTNSTATFADETISSPGTYTTTDLLMFNGTVIFDADQTFTGTNIWFGPMAKIIVNPNVNLQFTNCALSAGCNYMWQGIDLPESSSSMEISGSKIHDAICFVTSFNGGLYNIHNNNYDIKNNYVVATVYDAPPAFSSVFSNNYITCDMNTMYPPYAGKVAFCGVKTFNSRNVSIGPGNEFNSLLNGVWSEGSQVIVKGNTFKNMNSTLMWQYSAAAVYIQSGFPIHYSSPGWFTSIVGGALASDGNTFLNCNNGVVAKYNQNLSVENNTFNKISFYGVDYSWFSKASSASIKDNNFTNSSAGVHAYLNSYCSSTIEGNSFTWNGNPSTATGIHIAGTKFKFETYTIINNTFSKPKLGVYINSTYASYVQHNSVENLRSNTGPIKCYGIRAVNCFTPTISSNTISPSNYNPNQPATSSNINTGIQIENCAAPTVTCNTIRKVGTSLHVAGVNTASTIWDNDFIKSYRGISVTNGGSLGVQGSINRPSDNQWFFVGDHWWNDGTVIVSEFFVRTMPSNYSPYVGATDLLVKNYCSNSIPIFACPVAIIDDPSPLKFSITNELPLQSTESKGWNKKGLTKIIRQHPNWATNDTILAEFVDSLTLKPAVLFDSVLTKREEGLIIDARAINNSIVPELTMDDIEIEVNNYYLTLESGLSISTYENRIREIAQMCPFTEGEGVYKARILMEMFDPFNTVYFNECEDERAGKSMEFAQDIEPNFNVTVFPNPATEVITISIQSVERNFELIVYDNTGKEVLKTELNELISMIDLKQLEVGFYSYIIRSSSGQVSTGKFSKFAN